MTKNPGQMMELASFDMPEVDVSALDAEAALDNLEATTRRWGSGTSPSGGRADSPRPQTGPLCNRSWCLMTPLAGGQPGQRK